MEGTKKMERTDESREHIGIGAGWNLVRTLLCRKMRIDTYHPIQHDNPRSVSLQIARLATVLDNYLSCTSSCGGARARRPTRR